MPVVRSTRRKAPGVAAKALKEKLKPNAKAFASADKDGDRDDNQNYSNDGSDDYEESNENTDDGDKSMDSDALDDDESMHQSRKRKRARASPVKASPKKATPRRKKKKADDSGTEDGFELKEGQEIVGTVVQAPKTGRVPAGQISKNTFDFLTKLKDPKFNDRDWFKLHEPVYRLAEQEWKDFVEEFTTILVDEVDNQIPHLPPKDSILRIYRDIRFSNDKTPYKSNFSASLSRGGRKGIFASYYIQIQPGDESFLAAGLWCPAKNELQTLRAHIQHSSANFRSIISAPEFVAHFGEPKPTSQPKSAKNGDRSTGAQKLRRNIFGRDDELKVAPKGIDKDHPDIDLLKCRSFAVVHPFTDEQVLASNFKEELAKVAKVVQPFIRCLNDMITLPVRDDDSDEEDDDEE